MIRRLAWVAALLLLAFARTAAAQAWLDPSLLAAAKAEGAVTLFSSVSEELELPLMKLFQDRTGIKTDYVRGADASLMARIAIEKRAGKESWDVIEIQAVESLPKEWRLAFAPPEAAHLIAPARDPEQRWFGDFAVFHTPAYNTQFVASDSLPKTYAEFARHPEWAGHVAIDSTDRNWLAGIVTSYGEERGTQLIRDIVAVLHPTLYKGHLALARALGSGEYWIALNNYLYLTMTVMRTGDPVDYWVLDPVVATYCETAANARSPHPNAAKLLVNFLISAEAQALRAKKGNIPTRLDVESDPPGILASFQSRHLVPGALSPEQDALWQKRFNALFKQE